MYWFFNYNNYDTRAIQALVYSAYKHNPHFIPICLWDEPKYKDPELKNWLESRGVLVLDHPPILDLSKQFDIIKRYSDDLGWGINPLTVNGCWQKVDVPKICYDMDILDKYVLLTDPDCLWIDEFVLETEPPILAAATEEEPLDDYISGGIYVWNLLRSINDYNHFLFYCMQNFDKLGHGDNVGYLKYYGYQNLTILSPDWNYKVYWQELPNGLRLSPKNRTQFKANPRLLHFQGHSKPWMNFASYYKKWYGDDIVQQIEKYYKIWWSYYEKSQKIEFRFENSSTSIDKFDSKLIKSTPINRMCQLIPTI